jgi:hypothetical protein
LEYDYFSSQSQEEELYIMHKKYFLYSKYFPKMLSLRKEYELRAAVDALEMNLPTCLDQLEELAFVNYFESDREINKVS